MKKTINIYNNVDSIETLCEFVQKCADKCVEGEQIVEIKVIRKMDDSDPNKIGVGFGVQLCTLVSLD